MSIEDISKKILFDSIDLSNHVNINKNSDNESNENNLKKAMYSEEYITDLDRELNAELINSEKMKIFK